MKCILYGVVGALALVGGSCTTPARGTGAGDMPSGEWQVKADGLIGGGARALAIEPEALRVRVAKLAGEGRTQAIDRLVARHADATRVMLLEARGPGTELTLAAAAYERVCGITDGAWSARAGTVGQSTPLDTEIKRRRDALASGTTVAVFEKAPSQLSARVQVDEIARLDGISALLLGDPQTSAGVLEAAAERARGVDPEAGAEFALLASAAATRTGDAAGAAQEWSAGAEILGRLARAPTPVRVATLLERAVALRPAGVRWPEAILRAAESTSARVLGADVRFTDTSNNAAALALLAAFRLERGESDTALLAYARAQAACADERTRMQLRLGQAKSLVKTRREDDAQVLLATLSGTNDTAVAQPSQTLLAALLFTRGRHEQAEALLARLLGAPEAEANWPSRWSARANYATLLGARGENTEAARWLDLARADARASNDAEAVDALAPRVR